MTHETLMFLAQLLDQQNLSVAASDFEEMSKLIVNAKRELADEIAKGTADVRPVA